MNGIKNDKLDALIMMSADVLVEKNVKEFLETDTSDVVRPKSLDRRIMRIIKRERRKSERGGWITVAKNIAAGVLIACTVTLAMVMSIEAVRTALLETIVQWFEDYVSIMFVTEDDVPTTIEVKRQPVIDEDGWTEEIAVDSPSMYSVNYYHEGTLVLIYDQVCLNTDSIWNDNTDVTIEDISVGQSNGALMIYENGGLIVSWSDGEYTYSLSSRTSTISKEALLIIAESVQ